MVVAAVEKYPDYDNIDRPHLALEKDSPNSQATEKRCSADPRRLHHRQERKLLK
jgi:hypothetical protein